MDQNAKSELRRGWTTGACATAAVKAALDALWGDGFPKEVQITLPRGEQPIFSLAHQDRGEGWCEVGITKDAGDDPDVTHGALIIARVRASTDGVVFKAGEGVGTITKAGLPIGIGEAAINPVPRQMMRDVIAEQATRYERACHVEVMISIPGGEEIAKKTWNGRLGIVGGLSILGTTGVVRPFSCAAWIASIHRGVDVARADGLEHVAGCTGATSELAVQRHYGLPDHAMLDMGDFAGGLIKYIKTHPVPRFTLGGGVAKLVKFAQGAMDLHSARSQVDFDILADWMDDPSLKDANTALEVYERVGAPLGAQVAKRCLSRLDAQFLDMGIRCDVMVFDRAGKLIGEAH